MILLLTQASTETTDGNLWQGVWQPARLVYHCFDRIVIQGYLPLLTRPPGSQPCGVHQLDNSRFGYWDGGTTCSLWFLGKVPNMVWDRCDVFDTPPCGTGN